MIKYEFAKILFGEYIFIVFYCFHCFLLVMFILDDGIVRLQFCPTADQVADLLTKPLGVQSNTKFRNLLLCHSVVFITFPLNVF